MFSSRREKVESLCAIIKIWQGSIHTALVTDCAVQHDIIVISRQSPCRISFVNLCQSALQSPCQISFVIKWDKFNVSLPGTFCLVCNLLSVILGLGQRRGAHVLVFLIAPTATM
jgi:hypothetical protein